MQTSKDALPPTLWRWRGWWRPVRFLEKEHTAMNDNEVLCSVKDLRVERMTPLPHSQLSFSARTSPRAEGSFERSIVGQALIFNARNTDIRPCRLQRMHYHQPVPASAECPGHDIREIICQGPRVRLRPQSEENALCITALQRNVWPTGSFTCVIVANAATAKTRDI